MGLGFWITTSDRNNFNNIIVLMNSHPQKEAVFTLPDWDWSIVANAEYAGTKILSKGIKGALKIPSSTGMVLIK